MKVHHPVHHSLDHHGHHPGVVTSSHHSVTNPHHSVTNPHGAYPAASAAAAAQLMDMYSSGMSPATAINTMDWKNTSQVRLTSLAYVRTQNQNLRSSITYVNDATIYELESASLANLK